MHFDVAPPAPPLQRTAFVHEGFYFRLQVAPGVLFSQLTDKRTNAGYGGTGFAFAGDLLVGGSPAPGIAFGGALLTNTGFGLTLDGDQGALPSMTQFHFIAGPFFDAFPNNQKGFHLGAAVGVAGTSLENVQGSFAVGGGGAAFLGYDLWVAPEWSAGFELRGSGAYMGGDQLESSAFALNLGITVLNH
jgi:hypothetical protein